MTKATQAKYITMLLVDLHYALDEQYIGINPAHDLTPLGENRIGKLLLSENAIDGRRNGWDPGRLLLARRQRSRRRSLVAFP